MLFPEKIFRAGDPALAVEQAWLVVLLFFHRQEVLFEEARLRESVRMDDLATAICKATCPLSLVRSAVSPDHDAPRTLR